MSKMAKQLTNPTSSGDGGGNYEGRVQAVHLLAMLLGSSLPLLPDYHIVKIQFQARIHGFNTDDLVCYLESPYGRPCKRLIQIKRSLTTAASDKQFKEVMQAAWLDYCNQDVFQKETDSIAVICDTQGEISTREIRALTQIARTSVDAAEFTKKIQTARFSSDKRRTVLSEVRDIIDEVNGDNVPETDVYGFLRHLLFIPYDLSTEDSTLLAALLGQISQWTESVTPHQLWSNLVDLCREYNQQAATITRDSWVTAAPLSIVAAFQNRQSDKTLPSAAEVLKQHSSLVLDSINGNLPSGIVISRPELEDKIRNAVVATPVTILVGDAGNGKSALAKKIAVEYLQESAVYAFKVEDFDQGSLDAALTTIGVTIGSRALAELDFMAGPKIILIDGIEKVVEFESREALLQLLTMLRRNASLRIVLTARSHSLEVLYTSLLSEVNPQVIEVPPFTDIEFDSVVSQFPQLTTSASQPNIRAVLRTPFYLRLAMQYCGRQTRTLPNHISALKKFLWREAIEKPIAARDGLPRRRRKLFDTVCLARATQIVQFVDPPEDDLALRLLVNDGVLIEDKLHRVAPAHDIFDDWALYQHVERNVLAAEGDWVTLFARLGTHPGIRRAYRGWLTETVGNGVNEAQNLLEAALNDDVLPQLWRDESIVGMLRSSNADELIQQYERGLLEKEKAPLKRLVHLLRVACKGPNEKWIATAKSTSTEKTSHLRFVFTTPVGNAWTAVLKLISRNIADFGKVDAEWLIAFFEDWAKGIDDPRSPPPETEIVLKAAIKILIDLGRISFRREGISQRYFDMVMKTIGGAPVEAEAFLQQFLARAQNAWQAGDRDFEADEILQHALQSFSCAALCHFLPGFVAETLTFLAFSKAPRDPWEREDLEEAFGFRPHVEHNYFPASAYQGPFWFLLLSHPIKGINLTVRLCNQAASTYETSSLREAERISVPFGPVSEGLIFSGRLWALYRELMPGPNTLISALMALEKWLLDYSAAGGDVSSVLKLLITQSNSVLLISVVCSFMMAYPERVTEELLPVLKVKEFFQIDIQRYVHEQGHMTDIRSLMGIPSRGEQDIYYNERAESQGRKHRKLHLEHLMAQLQLTPLREAVFKILDEFYQALPSPDVQTDYDREWRLALKRMDLRGMRLGKPTPNGIPLEIAELESDLREFVDTKGALPTRFNRLMKLQLWAHEQLVGKISADNESQPSYQQALDEARMDESDESDVSPLDSNHVEAAVAAALVLRYCQHLAPTEYEWAESTILTAIFDEADSDDHLVQVSRNQMDGTRGAAYVLPLLLPVTQNKNKVLEAIATALTHASVEVKEYAASGVKKFLWPISPEMGKVCVSELFKSAFAKESLLKIPYDQRDLEWTHVVLDTRKMIWQRLGKGSADIPVISSLPRNVEDIFIGLSMVPNNSDEAWVGGICRKLVSNVAERENTCVEWKDGRSLRGRGVEDQKVDFKTRRTIAKFYAAFIHCLNSDVLDQDIILIKKIAEHAPDYTAEILNELLEAEDRNPHSKSFWPLWEAASSICFHQESIRESGLGYYRSHYDDLLRALLFCGLPWKETATDLSLFADNPSFIIDAIEAVGATPIGFKCLVTVLRGIGQRRYLPSGIIPLATALQSIKDHHPLHDRNTLFLLEAALRISILEHTTEVRRAAELRLAATNILDAMVEAGSSVAFQLRDYLATPARNLYT